jgi:uncharacterized protein (DUF924 family)
MKDVEDVLNFWFGSTDSAQSRRAREEWFKMNPAFDEQIRARFGSLHAQAAAHRLDDWETSIRGRLALILLLDQFSRNLYRDSPRAFACDAQALALAQAAIDARLDRDLLPLQRMFLYMPFQHSEHIEQQRRSLELFETLRAHPEAAQCYEYAVQHFEIITKFGRFPHRNSILGRASTPAELQYLQQPGAGF